MNTLRQLPTPAVDLAGAKISPPRDLRDSAGVAQRRYHRHLAHRTAANTGANTVAYTSDFFPS